MSVCKARKSSGTSGPRAEQIRASRRLYSYYSNRSRGTRKFVEQDHDTAATIVFDALFLAITIEFLIAISFSLRPVNHGDGAGWLAITREFDSFQINFYANFFCCLDKIFVQRCKRYPLPYRQLKIGRIVTT